MGTLPQTLAHRRSRPHYLRRHPRHVVHRGHDLTEFRDNWGGPGRSLLFWWLFRQLGRSWFAKGMENYGPPWPLGYADTKDPEAVNLLRDAFKLSKSIGGLVV